MFSVFFWHKEYKITQARKSSEWFPPPPPLCSRAGGIFSSTLPVELGVYRKIYPQLPEQYGESNLHILLLQDNTRTVIEIVCFVTQVKI